MHRAALQDVADRVGGTWHRQAGSPEPGTDRTIRVGVLSRLSFTTLDPVAPFPDKLRAIQQGDGRPSVSRIRGQLRPRPWMLDKPAGGLRSFLSRKPVADLWTVLGR